MEIIRYANEGFISYPQQKSDILIYGCHAMAMVEDLYLLTGNKFKHRILEKRNVINLDKSVEVWTRNLYYYSKVNHYGYTQLCCDIWSTTDLSWIKVPLWWVKWNIETIISVEGDCNGYFAADIIVQI